VTTDRADHWKYFYFKNGAVGAQMRRIASLNGRIPSGGADAFLADFLENSGVASVVLSSFDSSVETERYQKVIVREYSKDGLTDPLGCLIKLTRNIVAARPDRILCGRQGYALLSCLIAGRFLDKPVVFSGHNRIRQGSGIAGELRYRIDSWLIRRCAATICHGPYLADELSNIGVPKNKIHVFDSDCGDLMGMAASERQSPSVEGRRRILFVGRFVKPKGIFDLLDAFANSLNRGIEGTLVYAGNGAQLPELEAAVRERGLIDHVDFTGRLTYAQVGDEIRRSWVVVTPTRSEFPEGRCMAAMEALALGVPVIAPDAGPFPFLVKDRVNGLLFRQDSVEGLTAALSDILNTPELRQRLSQGAIADRSRFLKADVTFSQAVLRAFQDADHNEPGKSSGVEVVR